MKKAAEDVLKELVIISSLLKKKAFHEKEALCKKLNLEPKTIERRLARIKEIETDFVLINDRIKGYKLIPRKGLEEVITKKENVLLVNGKDDMYETATQNKIRLLDKAITEKKWVILKNYKPANKKPIEDRTVLPILLVLKGEARIIAIDDEIEQRKKTFNLNRMGEVVVLPRKSNCMIDLSNIKHDDFGLMYEDDKKLKKMTLFLTTYSSEMITRDFPVFKLRIKPVPKELIKKELNGEAYKYHYKLVLNICHIGAVGRMVCGMLDNIIVRTDDDTLRDELKDYVRKTVLNAFEENI